MFKHTTTTLDISLNLKAFAKIWSVCDPIHVSQAVKFYSEVANTLTLLVLEISLFAFANSVEQVMGAPLTHYLLETHNWASIVADI